LLDFATKQASSWDNTASRNKGEEIEKNEEDQSSSNCRIIARLMASSAVYYQFTTVPTHLDHGEEKEKGASSTTIAGSEIGTTPCHTRDRRQVTSDVR
jgi:hypothetical protein